MSHEQSFQLLETYIPRRSYT